MRTIIEGSCHEVYRIFLVCWFLRSDELGKQRTAAANQSQLSNASVIDIIEEYI